MTFTLGSPEDAVLLHYDTRSQIIVSSEDKSFPLGTLLFKYLDLDNKVLNRILDKYFNIPMPKNKQEHQNNLNLIMEGLNRLFEIHPYFISLASRESEDNLIDKINQYIESANEVINNEGLQFDRNLEPLAQAIQNLRNPFSEHDLHVNNFYINHLRSTIEFCFFDSRYPEFTDLKAFDRFEIYDTVHVGILGSKRFEQSISALNSYAIKDEDRILIDLGNKHDREKVAQKFKESSNRFVTLYDTTPFTALLIELSTILKSGLKIKKCDICDRYFIPDKRTDEVYCDRINLKGKTCKEIGWHSKKKSIEYVNYKRVYEKFRNLVIRNESMFDSLGYPVKSNEIFEEWTKIAIDKRKKVSDVALFPSKYDMQLADYISWLNKSYKEIKKVIQNKLSVNDSDTFLEDPTRVELIHWLNSINERRPG